MVTSNNLTSSELLFLEYSNISEKLLASFISETHHSLNVIILHHGAGQANDSS
jgi:hypothetical protein